MPDRAADRPLAGRVALITGASSGIGLAAARRLAAQDVTIVAVGRREDRLQAIRREFPATRCLAGDLGDPAIVDRAFALADEAGGPDIVLNNAGTMTSGPIEELDHDRVSDMVRLNVEASFRVMHLAVRRMKARGEGHLVNISSSVVARSVPTGGAYAGTKRAIEGLAEALRQECAGTGVRITNLQPGLVESELHRDYPAPMAQLRGFSAPLMPDDVVDALLFVLTRPPHVRIPSLMIVPGESGQ